MVEVVLLCICTAAGCLAAVAGYPSWFSEIARVRRALRDTPRSAIRDAKNGDVVKLVGRVRPAAQPLVAPMAGCDCTFYDVTVQRVQSSATGRQWVELIRERRVVDFLVEDGTGRAFVRGSELRFALVKDADLDPILKGELEPDDIALLRRHGHESSDRSFEQGLRYKEVRFETGDTITVAGRVRRERDPDPTEAGTGYRDGPKRVVLEPFLNGFVLVTDDPVTA